MDEDRLPTETITLLEAFPAPFNREITVQDVTHESGMKMLRLRIKEGKSRFTILDLDPATAAKWGGLMADWAKQNS